MVDRLQSEPKWPRLSTKVEIPLRPDNQDEHRVQPAAKRASEPGSVPSAADTIFDFQLPNVSSQEVADLHRRAEYLLDEMEMGAADRAAQEREPDVLRTHSSQNGVASSPPKAVPALSSPAEKPSRILPETVLPSIRNRPQPAETPRPALFEARPLRGLQPEPIEATPPPAQESVLATPVSRRSTLPLNQIDAAPISISMAEAQKLSEEIEALYAQVNRLQETRRDLTGHALSLLREARAILLNQPERIGRADYNIRQVRTLLQRAQESRRRSIRTGVLLLFYLALWLMVCAAGITSLFLYADAIRLLLTDGAINGTLSPHMLPLMLTILAGATGGVIGAIFALFSHLRQGQEFDRQYGLRYTIQPVMGVVLAIVIYLLSNVLFNAAGMTLTSSVVTAAFPAVVALPAGLWQEMVYAMLYRFTGIFRFSRRR